ncbi:hypothetical protein, partial [Pseudomonas yamanorum]|uniref:hypothetical protein n=1 Tax=Pseudomonas yamanorum TaxID=515393 RepID=UPI003BA0D3E5
PESAALIQNARVIVNDLREQARSHIWTVPALAFDFVLQDSSRPGGRCAFDLLLILGAPKATVTEKRIGTHHPGQPSRCTHAPEPIVLQTITKNPMPPGPLGKRRGL